MKNNENITSGNRLDDLMEAAIKIGALALIVYWCFLIFRPFITIIVWSIIIAVAAYPVFRKISRWLGGRKGLAAMLLVVVALVLVIIPGIGLTGSVIQTGKAVTKGLEEGTLEVDPPNEQVRDWPVLGKQVYELWSQASTSLENTLQEYSDQVKVAVGWLFRSLATLGLDVLFTIIALIIAGVLMTKAEAGDRLSKSFFTRMVGEAGEVYSNSARDTIRSVVQGVVLVAVIQSVLAWLGFVLIGLPAAGVWAILVLLFSIMQLPPTLIILPIIIYVFSYASTGAAIAFAVWGVVVSISDNILKPVFLGRGLDIPMLVILIGALGGMMLHGIIGLFIGAVIMSIGYKLFIAWLQGQHEKEDLI